MGILNFRSKPKKYYWYDVNQKYFYIPGENNILRFNVLEALVLIGSIRLLHMDKKTLFNKIEWPNYITYTDIKQFVQAWENGLFDPTIEWICENNIECQYENKKDYLYNETQSNPSLKIKNSYFSDRDINNKEENCSLYEINKDVLKEYYDDLIELEDWIPELIRISLPLDISTKIGTRVKNKELWANRIKEHRLQISKFDSYYDLENSEVEEFIRKYPKFGPIFKKL